MIKRFAPVMLLLFVFFLNNIFFFGWFLIFCINNQNWKEGILQA